MLYETPADAEFAVHKADKIDPDQKITDGQDTTLAAASQLPFVADARVVRVSVSGTGPGVRWRIGSSPTATVGMFVPSGQTVVFVSHRPQALNNIFFIETAASCQIDYVHFR